MTKRYLVTSALPYANGPLHVGHLAGAYLTADIFVRYLRLAGKDVLFVCGSDEHGAAITMRAKKEGLQPQEIIDKYDTSFRQTFKGIGIDFDIFHRTSSPLHHQTSQDFFNTLYQNNAFEAQESEQYFDESAQQFLADRYIMGTCPKCGNPDAYGDQCEKCGSTLSPDELLPPIRSVLSGATPLKKKTTHWFLKLNEYQPLLERWIEKGEYQDKHLHDPTEWKNHVLGQCKSWLEQGLQPRAMTRDLEWGVDVPSNIPHSEGKKLYVWLDAPIGYISASKQWAINQGTPDAWQKYWKDEDTELVHFIGKDNIVFHCLIFPSILMAHGGYVLPKNVPANQFMNLEGRKISTSKNWAVWVHEYLQDFEGKEDALRYNMVRNMPETRDSEFTWRGFQETNDSELVGNLANFINRVVVLTNKYYEGKVPVFDTQKTFKSSQNTIEDSYFEQEMALLRQKVDFVASRIMAYDFRAAMQGVMDISSMGNQLLQFNEPWKSVKTDADLTAAVMHTALQIVGAIAYTVRPFLPFTSDKMLKMLGLPAIAKENGEWLQVAEKPIFEVGHQIGEPLHLFTRIPNEMIDAQMQKLAASEQENQANQTEDKANETPNFPALKETIQYDDFAKMDIRTATIVAAEKVAKADKLLKLTVDMGFETRTIVSGIALHFQPEEIVGQQVVVLANLAPRPLRGIESNGMILMAEDAEGKLTFVQPQKAWVNGFGVK